IIGERGRADEPREFGLELGARFDADLRTDVHGRRRHAHVAWWNFSTLRKRKHAPRRRSHRWAKLVHGHVFASDWGERADRLSRNDEPGFAHGGRAWVPALISNGRNLERQCAPRPATSS